MDRLDRLPEVTDHVLSGLQADDDQKQRILLSAVEAHKPEQRNTGTVVALLSLSVLLILLCVFASGWSGGQKNAELQNIPAGSHRNGSPVNLQNVIDKASELSQENIP